MPTRTSWADCPSCLFSWAASWVMRDRLWIQKGREVNPSQLDFSLSPWGLNSTDFGLSTLPLRDRRMGVIILSHKMIGSFKWCDHSSPSFWFYFLDIDSHCLKLPEYLFIFYPSLLLPQASFWRARSGTTAFVQCCFPIVWEQSSAHSNYSANIYWMNEGEMNALVKHKIETQ